MIHKVYHVDDLFITFFIQVLKLETFSCNGCLPEKQEEAIELEANPNNGPADQNDQHTTEEETGGLHLVLLKEEPEGPLETNDKCQTYHKKNLEPDTNTQ